MAENAYFDQRLECAATKRWSKYTTLKSIKIEPWAEIHQALLSQFSLSVEFFIGKVKVKEKYSRVLNLVNLDPGNKSGSF